MFLTPGLAFKIKHGCCSERRRWFRIFIKVVKLFTGFFQFKQFLNPFSFKNNTCTKYDRGDSDYDEIKKKSISYQRGFDDIVQHIKNPITPVSKYQGRSYQRFADCFVVCDSDPGMADKDVQAKSKYDQ